MDRVKDKVALVTGAAQGIGLETAKLLSKEGAQVIITDINDEGIQDRIRDTSLKYEHLDVKSESQWQELTQKIKKDFGHLDILFNNAGITGLNENLGPQDPEHASLESWQEIHKINLDGVFLGCKYGIELMKNKGGSIVNMSSRSGLVGIPGAAAYASSKAAIHNHTKTVALYCAQKGYNIRCNSVHPGAILTPLWDSVFGSQQEERKKVLEKIESGIPLGKMGDAIDVAFAVLYLASNEAKYVTGTHLIMDGGILAGSSASFKKNDK